MKDLFIKVFGTSYNASGEADPFGDLVLNVITPRDVLDRVYTGELAPKRFLYDKENYEESFYVSDLKDLQLCDTVRLLFDERMIFLSLCQVLDIWSEHSEDLYASWLGWDGTRFEELNAIREDFIAGERSSLYTDDPWKVD